MLEVQALAWAHRNSQRSVSSAQLRCSGPTTPERKMMGKGGKDSQDDMANARIKDQRKMS